jgi:hypothetical protein
MGLKFIFGGTIVAGALSVLGIEYKTDAQLQKEQDFNNCVAQVTVPLLPPDVKITTDFKSGTANFNFQATQDGYPREVDIQTAPVENNGYLVSVNEATSGQLPGKLPEIYLSGRDWENLKSVEGATAKSFGISLPLLGDAVNLCRQQSSVASNPKGPRIL